MPAVQGNLFDAVSKAATIGVLARLVKKQARVEKAKRIIKKLEDDIELAEREILAEFQKPGTYVIGDFTVTVTESQPACRPSWKDEFMKLAVLAKMDAEAAVIKVTERVKKTLKPVKKVTVKKVDEVK